MQKMFFEVYKQHQGEYMGSLLSAFFESMGSGVATTRDDLDMIDDAIDSRARRRGQRQRRQVPARLPVEQEEPEEAE